MNWLGQYGKSASWDPLGCLSCPLRHLADLFPSPLETKSLQYRALNHENRYAVPLMSIVMTQGG